MTNERPASFREEWEALRAAGLDRAPRVLPANAVNLSSNDYLGLSRHPDVIAAARAALEAEGTGGRASRLLAGTAAVHEAFERGIASFLGTEAALLFATGYQTNVGALSALLGPSDIVFFDRLSHASIIDGVRLSGAGFAAYRHNDVAHLDSLLAAKRAGRRRAVVVTEGVFSMDGHRPPLNDIVAAAERHDALVYLDEAHSLGVMGPGGRGVAAEEGVAGRVAIRVGTLSKALGAQGGFVAGSQDLIRLLSSRARGFIFTTALAPAAAAAGLAALSLIKAADDARAVLRSTADRLRRSLAEAGFDTLTSASHILPIWTGSVEETRRFSDHLFAEGFFVPSIRPPTVAPGQGRVRLSVCRDIPEPSWERFLRAASGYPTRPKKRGEPIVHPR